jgi:cytochrome c biogenesis protein CcmG, thiol:disulfide interchange protein DsbE
VFSCDVGWRRQRVVPAGNVKRAFLALPIVALLTWLLAFGFGRDPGAIQSPLVGKAAPLFVLKPTHGHQSVSLAALRGTPVILNFWASWCVGCRVEHPYLVQAERRWGRQVHFIGIVYEDSAAAADDFMRGYGSAWPDLVDPNSAVAINYGVYGVPETFFIDGAGRVMAKRIGPLTPSLLSSQIHQLLARSAHRATHATTQAAIVARHR